MFWKYIIIKTTVEASYDKGKTWVQKTATNHTFFPNEWSRERVIDEIASAFKEGRMKEFPQQICDFQGRSKSGVLIRGYLNNSGEIMTAFPVFGL